MIKIDLFYKFRFNFRSMRVGGGVCVKIAMDSSQQIMCKSPRSNILPLTKAIRQVVVLFVSRFHRKTKCLHFINYILASDSGEY